MTSVKGGSRSAVDPSADAPFVELMGRLMQEIRITFEAEDWDGLRQSHFRLMYNVPREGISITDLADRLNMTKQASGQFVTFLAGTGHLDVRPDPGDGRVRVVVRTALGDRTIKKVLARMRRIEGEWAKAVGRERYAEFRAVLTELGDYI
jgi:DNA-binding MarR family transcriptional regulator